jgi:galactose-1-phosphate uridylyltransferase
VAENQSCEIEMSLLKKFDLEQGDQIIFRVAAHNLVGWSDYSELNSDIIAQMVVQPHKPLTPQRDDI